MADLYFHPGDPLDGPERWAPVVGYESLYEVSTHSRVRRIVGGQGTRGRMPYYLKPFLGAGRSGLYPQVKLSGGSRSKEKTHRVHHVVALAFLGQPPVEEVDGHRIKMQVGHINNKPDDNRAVNLEWTSQYENLMEEQQRYYGKLRA